MERSSGESERVTVREAGGIRPRGERRWKGRGRKAGSERERDTGMRGYVREEGEGEKEKIQHSTKNYPLVFEPRPNLDPHSCFCLKKKME